MKPRLRRSRSLVLVPTALLLATATATTQVVLPTKARLEPGTYINSYAFYGSRTRPNEARTQVVHDASILGGGAVLRSLRVRRSGTWSTTNRASTFDVVLTMSTSSIDPLAPDKVFANNHGSDRRVVYSGKVSLPDRGTVQWPAPWETAIAFSAPFTTPKAGARALVVEFQTSGSTSQNSWSLEAYVPDRGEADYAWTSGCRTSEGGLVNMHSFRPPLRFLPGQDLEFGFAGWPSHQKSLSVNALVLGAQGPGTVWGGRRLPIDLASLGLPAGSGCSLAIDVATTLPMDYVEGPTTRPNMGWLVLQGKLRIPAHPGMIDRSFYLQSIGVDRDTANRPVLAVSGALKVRIGDGVPLPGSTVIASGNRAATSGTVRASEVTPMRFE